MANYKKKYKAWAEDEGEPWNEKIPGVVYATPKDWDVLGYSFPKLMNYQNQSKYVIRTQNPQTGF